MPRKNKLIIRSGTAAPSAGDFVAGEPAWDATNGKFYIKNSAGTMVEITGAGGGSSGVVEAATASAFPATGAASTIYIDRSTNRLYRWASEGAYAEIGSLDSDSTNWTLLYPTAPTSVSGAARHASALLTWTAPTYSGTPLTDYLVQYSTNGSTWTTFSDGTSTAASATVTGLTNGTAYTFRVAAVNGLGASSYSTASSSVTPAAGDASYGSVRMLLKFEGTGSAFSDTVSTATITANGSSTQSTAQAKYGSKSLLLSTSSDWLSAAASGFNVGTGDFTAEAWIYPTSNATTYRHVFDTRTADTNGFALGLDNSNRVFLFSNNAFQVQAGSVSLNQWSHIAICRASGVTRVFLNGTQVGSDWSNTVSLTQTTLLVGKYYVLATNFSFIGHMDEIRWTNAARYTSTFTPSTVSFPEYST